MFLLVPKFVLVWALTISLLLNGASWFFGQPVDKVLSFAESKVTYVTSKVSQLSESAKVQMRKI